MPKQKRPEPRTFNDGLVEIFDVDNAGAPGMKPVQKLTLKGSLRFCERTVGLQRFTQFGQLDVEISRLIRVPRKIDVSTQDVAVINGETEYRIRQVQYPEKAPGCMDISLERIETRYAGFEADTGSAAESDV